MELENSIIAFIKAVELKYFDNFINKGEICMETDEFFRDYEVQDPNKGDGYENAKAACGNGMTISGTDQLDSNLTEKEIIDKIHSVEWQHEFNNCTNFGLFDSNSKCNIFCLYAVVIDRNNRIDNVHLVPTKFINEFTNHRFVFIYNAPEFIFRLNKAITNHGKTRWGMVEYYPLNNKLKSDLDIFNKQDKYAYQNEFRVIFEDKNAKQAILNLGSLNDICFEVDFKKNRLKIDAENAKFEIKVGDK